MGMPSYVDYENGIVVTSGRMPVSLYLESDPGIICSFTGKKTDAFYLAGGIDSFRG